MFVRTLLSISLAVAACGSIATAAAPAKGSAKAGKTANDSDSVASKLPSRVQTALAAGDYKTAQQALINELKGMTITPDNTQALNLAMLLEVIRVSSPEAMAEMATDMKKRKFLTAFANDPAWQELYLGCGLVPTNTAVGLNVLYNIWVSEKGSVKNKGLAVALASVWGGGETDMKPNIQRESPKTHNPVWRYNYFQTQQAKGSLHPNYPKLRPWELRFVVGIPGQDWDDKSYEWCINHINVPWDRYGWACWAAIYTDPSLFGDSVQSGAYQLPFQATESRAELTHINGGVCGSLSHLGCVAAMAHGIPAYTVGQPGHCAYGFRVERGKWVGGFGGPDGGMHNQIFGHRAPTSYLLMETVFKNNAVIDKAYRQSFCARAIEACGDKAGARKMWEQALQTSPVHPFFRKQLQRLMKEDGLTPDAAAEYLKSIIPSYKGNGFAAAENCDDLKDIISGMTDEQKLAIYSALQKSIAGTQASWAVKANDFFQSEADSLQEPKSREKYLSMLLNTHLNTGDGTTFGQVIEWAVANYMEKGDVEGFVKAFNEAASKTPSNALTGNGDKKAAEEKSKKLREAYGKAIIGTEKARSAAAFQALSNAAQKLFGNEPSGVELKQPAGMKGNLADPMKSMFQISATAQWDSPVFHRDILTPKGGKCHTDRAEKPSFTVELPKSDLIYGCVIRKTDGNEYRMKKAKIYTSADGATWVEAAQTADMPKLWEVQFEKPVQGKWVKLELDNSGDPQFAHISHFNVYQR